MYKLLVTGGAGFIGSNFVIDMIKKGNLVINVDKLTYAGNLENLRDIRSNPNHIFIESDIGDENNINKVLEKYQPDAIINFAAETHVDRSIVDPDVFVKTNVLSTNVFFRTVKDWWMQLPEHKRETFRFIHISTDEVYGALNENDPPFTEETNYAPNSPYSASKASSDFIARSYNKTYKLPVIITNCSNNYGPRQNKEKLIPLVITNALSLKSIPIYGNGKNVRDWLYVKDHCSAIYKVLQHGRIGQKYNIGGLEEKTNIDVVNILCSILDELYPRKDGNSYKDLIRFVPDRKGHDFRYAINCEKISKELNWRPENNFAKALRETVEWYLQNNDLRSEL